MKVKLNFPHIHAGVEHQPGEIIELPDKKAEWLLKITFPAKSEDGIALNVPAATRAD